MPNKKIILRLKNALSYILEMPLNKKIWPQNKDLRLLKTDTQIAQTEKSPKNKLFSQNKDLRFPPVFHGSV